MYLVVVVNVVDVVDTVVNVVCCLVVIAKQRQTTARNNVNNSVDNINKQRH